MDNIRAHIADAIDVTFNEFRKEYGLSFAAMEFPTRMREAYESCIDDLTHLAEVWIEIELEE